MVILILFDKNNAFGYFSLLITDLAFILSIASTDASSIETKAVLIKQNELEDKLDIVLKTLNEIKNDPPKKLGPPIPIKQESANNSLFTININIKKPSE